MCTVVLLRRPDHPWPLIVGANRDEMLNRPWQPPARHWADRPDVVAGLDELAGGTWMGVNDTGVVACILNRQGALGPAPGKRSRGELVLEALDHADAADAAAALTSLDGQAYRPFNMVVADNRDAFWLTLRDPKGRVEAAPIPAGTAMLTARELNDPGDPRIARYLPRFLGAAAPDPDKSDWRSWQTLLAATESDNDAARAMSFRTETGFGTSSASIVALPSMDASASGTRPIWLFAAGPPESTPFASVPL